MSNTLHPGKHRSACTKPFFLVNSAAIARTLLVDEKVKDGALLK